MKAIGTKMVELQPMRAALAVDYGYKIGNAHTRSGFDTVRHSSCVDPKNYSEELGKQYAMEEVINSLWSHLGFVLQWAKYGLNAESKKDKYPSHVQRMIDEYKELDDRINKLASFINTNPIFETL